MTAEEGGGVRGIVYDFSEEFLQTANQGRVGMHVHVEGAGV